ncbi:hypothetical protein PFTANZ_05199 [Plasmodium falciparum Tanzania (2000708)]|uniref:Protein kinase domain-containing protein n=1 Tax=Plasmodium falciparum Tanzania (2000708) TaxID=1036725 RepID=A0A024VZD1_PLAFA|nr:hypothetical protein PFTANZ_05199 [Plasmodium falciparum Tanzania (2000708)]
MGNALNKLLKHYRNVEKKKNEYKFGKILGCGSFGYDEILNKNINWKGKEFSSLSIEAVDFLKRLLERNEKKRLTAYQALHHPWITSQVG